jgi:hypothetical protein
MKIKFESDQVKVKSGHRVDGSGEVTFMIGEYQLQNIVGLVTVKDQLLRITVEVDDEGESA